MNYANWIAIPDSAEETVPEWNTWSATPAQRSVQWNEAQSLRSIVPLTRPEADAIAFVSKAPPAESIDAMNEQRSKRLWNSTSFVELTSMSSAAFDEDEMRNLHPRISLSLNSCDPVTSLMRKTARAAVVRSVSEPHVQSMNVPESSPQTTS